MYTAGPGVYVVGTLLLYIRVVSNLQAAASVNTAVVRERRTPTARESHGLRGCWFETKPACGRGKAGLNSELRIRYLPCEPTPTAHLWVGAGARIPASGSKPRPYADVGTERFDGRTRPLVPNHSLASLYSAYSLGPFHTGRRGDGGFGGLARAIIRLAGCVR